MCEEYGDILGCLRGAYAIYGGTTKLKHVPGKFIKKMNGS
jgi:hypothetical protein